MSKELYKKLLTDLGQSVGLPDLAADDDDYCCLGFDDKIVTHLQYNEENDVLMMFAQLGIIDEDKQADMYPRILKANLFWQGTGGATIGIDDETREVLMCYQTSMNHLDFQKFQELLEGFINTSELWINTLEAVQRGEDAPGAEDKKAASSEGDAAPPMPGGGIRA